MAGLFDTNATDEPERLVFLVPTRPSPPTGDPEDKPWPPTWPPEGDFHQYCTVDDKIDLRDKNGGIVCRLSRVCLLYRSVQTNYDGSNERITVASYSRPFQLWNNWVRSAGEKAYVDLISFTSVFFDQGHFDNPAHQHEFPSGKVQRVCGVDQSLGVAAWPANYNDLEPNYMYPRDPLPYFDESGYLKLEFYLSAKHCGLPPI